MTKRHSGFPAPLTNIGIAWTDLTPANCPRRQIALVNVSTKGHVSAAKLKEAGFKYLDGAFRPGWRNLSAASRKKLLAEVFDLWCLAGVDLDTFGS